MSMCRIYVWEDECYAVRTSDVMEMLFDGPISGEVIDVYFRIVARTVGELDPDCMQRTVFISTRTTVSAFML